MEDTWLYSRGGGLQEVAVEDTGDHGQEWRRRAQLASAGQTLAQGGLVGEAEAVGVELEQVTATAAAEEASRLTPSCRTASQAGQAGR